MRREFAWRSISLASLFAVIGSLIIVQMVRIQVGAEAADFRDETRRYVKNVLAFDTIYQHKLGENNPVLLHGLERIFVSELTLSKASAKRTTIAVK